MPRPQSGAEIREAFLRFFEERGHLKMPAASLIPAGDPTLLLTNSGMAQFKSYFSGEAAPPHPRIATAQKCFRTSDIEDVGDATHLTLFEMLGNFSFGDYFKEEACRWGLEFMHDVLGFPLERLYVTIYKDDDEVESIWRELGIPAERIYRFGDEHNWWGPAGDEGPCGPCSEINIYKGDLNDVPATGDARRERWGPNLSDDFVEAYNLVFTQFYHHLDGHRTELPNKNIDTGMGLERTAAAVQGVDDVYATDLFRPLIEKARSMARGDESDDARRALRVAADHGRSAAFLIADGVVPGNTGRGYVLRRLIRRAVRFGRSIGLETPFMPELAQVAIDHMGSAYPELVEHGPFVLRVLELEEQKFAVTVDQGAELLIRLIKARPAINDAMRMISTAESPWGAPHLDEALAAAAAALAPFRSGPVEVFADLLERTYLAAAREEDASPASVGAVWDRFLGDDWTRRITGYEAAYLYDTFGFPLEVTTEIAREHDLDVDREGFEREMDVQRRRGRAVARFGGDAAAHRVFEEMGAGETTFLGYEQLDAESAVVGLLKDGVPADKASEGELAEVVLQATPFYPEGGGQVGDKGLMQGEGVVLEVSDTQSPVHGLIVHSVKVTRGTVRVGDRISAHVDPVLRERTKRNHTATHLLHASLREVLGKHVRQAGSLVAPDRLRFDFTHVSALSREEMLAVQRMVNDKIRHDISVQMRETTYREAIEAGAIAFFGDKYDHAVRTVEIANAAPFSYELCGGTHVSRTGEIGSMFIIGQSSIGAGLRRLDAVTGVGAEDLVWDRFGVLDSLSSTLQAPVHELAARARSVLDELEEARRRISRLEQEAARGSAAELLDAVIEVNGVNLLVAQEEASSAGGLREMGDHLRDRMGSGIIVLGSVVEDRPIIVAMVTKDLVARGFHAGNIVQSAAQLMGGGGGGRPDVAQAGGRDAGRLAEALAAVRALVAAGPKARPQPARRNGGAP